MLTDFQNLVEDFVRDDSGKVSTTQRDVAISLAVLTYSQDRPKSKVQDVVSIAPKLLPLPAAWVDDFSTLLEIEMPIGEIPATLLTAEDYQLYLTPTGLQIQSATIQLGDHARLAFTVPHELSGAVDSIPLIHREYVCCYAAANLLDQLAVLYSGDSDSTIQADSVSHQTKAGEYASRAKALRKRYQDALGVDPKRASAASGTASMTAKNSVGGEYFFHNRRGVR